MNTTKRKPDLHVGIVKAWKVPMHPDKPASLGAWYLIVPGAHAFWNEYYVCACHLRPIEGELPPRLHYPAATHELTIAALDPDCPHDVDAEKPTFGIMEPVDLVYQCHGLRDDQMAGLLQAVVNIIVHGRMSPDADYRHAWRSTLDTTVRCIISGKHETH